MSKNKKVLIISIFLGMVFFNISSSAMINNSDEKKRENTSETKKIMKKYQEDEKKKDGEDSDNIKSEIKTESKILSSEDSKKIMKKYQEDEKKKDGEDSDNIKSEKKTEGEILGSEDSKKIMKKYQEDEKKKDGEDGNNIKSEIKTEGEILGSEDSKKIMKKYQEDEKKKDGEDGNNIKSEIKTEGKTFDNIEKFKLILEKISWEGKKKLMQGFSNILRGKECLKGLEYIVDIKNIMGEEYFKKFIQFLYLSLKEKCLYINIDEVIDLIEDSGELNLFIEKLKKYLDKKFMLIEAVKSMKSGSNTILLSDIERHVKSSRYEILKYYFFSENYKKEFIDNVTQLIDKYELNFFEELEELIQKFLEKKGEELKEYLLGLTNKSVKQEYLYRTQADLWRYLDERTVFKIINSLRRSSDDITGEVNRGYIIRMINLAEKYKSKFLENLIDFVNREYVYKVMLALSKDKKKAESFKEAIRKIKKEYEEYNKKMFNENNLIEDIKTKLEEMKLCLNEDLEESQEKFKSNLDYLSKKLEGKFKYPRADEHMEILFKSLKGEELKKFIDKIIKLAENNDVLDFLYQFDNLIHDECARLNCGHLINEIQGIVHDIKNTMEEDEQEECWKNLERLMKISEEDQDERRKNLKKLTKILIENGVKEQIVQKFVGLVIDGYVECKEFLDIFMSAIKKMKNNFLMNMGVIVDGEIKRRELNRKIYHSFMKKRYSELTENEIEEAKKYARILYFLKKVPIADARYEDIEFIANAALRRNNQRLIIDIKRNNENCYIEYKLVNMNDSNVVEVNTEDLDTDVE